jgi:hypothetical protein
MHKAQVALSLAASLLLVACAAPLAGSVPADRAFEPPRPAPQGIWLLFRDQDIEVTTASRGTDCPDRAAEEKQWLREAIAEELLRAGYGLETSSPDTTAPALPHLFIQVERMRLTPCGWLSRQLTSTKAAIGITVILQGTGGHVLYQRTLEGRDEIPPGAVASAPRIALGNAAAQAMRYVTRDAVFTATLSGTAPGQ